MTDSPEPTTVNQAGQGVKDTSQVNVSPSRARSLANLVPFQKGHDPRRNNGGAPGQGFIRHKQNLCRVDQDVLALREKGYAAGGRPFALEDMKELMDRELGKPHQRVMVQTQAIPALTDIQAAAAAMIEANPALKQLLDGGGGAPALPAGEAGAPQGE